MTIEVRRLSESDDRTAFNCGDQQFDRFFRQYAGQNQFRHYLGVTYVAVEAGRILGYATISPSEVEVEDLPKSRRKDLKYPLPVLRLARLAVDAGHQRKGVGAILLRMVFELAVRMAEEYGCHGVVVDAKESAVAYYNRFGFEPMPVVEGASSARPLQTPMFLSLKTILRAKTRGVRLP